jgi:hypothetical protein
MKILTICRGGIVRSVALASVLRYEAGHDPIAYGVEWGTPETMQMLCAWADRVVLMQPEYADATKLHDRHIGLYQYCVCDVGPDVWSNPLHPDLLARVRQYVAEWGARGYGYGFDMKF